MTIENLPMSPDCPYTTPQHDETILCQNLVMERDDDISAQIYYYGQHPVFCQNIQTDKLGNILFFIIDNNIYNRYGESFENIHQQNLYSQQHYWLHQIPASLESNNPVSEKINRSFMVGTSPIPLSTLTLGQEMSIVPVPGSVNVYYLIYSIDTEYNQTNNTDRNHYFYYRKLTYYSDTEITMTPAEIISNEVYCSENKRHHLAISDYRSSENDYLMYFIHAATYIEVCRISSQGIELNLDASLNPIPYNYLQSGDLSNSNFFKGYNTNEMELFYENTNNKYKLALTLCGEHPVVKILEFPYQFASYSSSYTPNQTLIHLPHI